MLTKNILWMFLLLPSIASFVTPHRQARIAEATKWVISQGSNLCVNGSTNINTFKCEIPNYDHTDTLTLKNKSGQEIALSGCVTLSIESFDCHNTIMTHDLRKTLKEKEFPVLHIYFLSLSKLPELSARPEPVTGLVDIEIAGTRKRFEVNYQISVDAQKVIHLVGSRDVNFSDFKLIPPKKLGGMIRTNDKLGVVFHLEMKTTG